MSVTGMSGRGCLSKPREDAALYKIDQGAVAVDKIQVGDEITVSVTVSQVGSPAGDLYFNVGGAAGSFLNKPFWVSAKQIVSHTPRKLAVGDDVIAPDGNGHGVIKAIEDGIAFVRFAPTIFVNYRLADLKRVRTA